MLREGESPHPVPNSRKKNSVGEDNSLEKGVVSILPAANERSGFVADNVRDFGCFPVKTRHAQDFEGMRIIWRPGLNFAWVNRESRGTEKGLEAVLCFGDALWFADNPNVICKRSDQESLHLKTNEGFIRPKSHQ